MSSSNQEPPHKGGEGVREVEYRNAETGPWGWGVEPKKWGWPKTTPFMCHIYLEATPFMFHQYFCLPPPAHPPGVPSIHFRNNVSRSFSHVKDGELGITGELHLLWKDLK